jgi:hypothetical protein
MDSGVATVIGHDAEFILEDAHGNPVSCHELPGKGQYVRTADYLKIAESLYRDGKFGSDGIFLEATNHASSCRNSVIPSLFTSLWAGWRVMCQRFGEPLRVKFGSEVILDQDFIESLPGEVNVAGCAPSRNAYNEPRYPTPGTPVGPIRWTGLHIHLSHPTLINNDTHQMGQVVKYLDQSVGLCSVVMDPFPDETRRRREVYGEAGCFRLRLVPHAWDAKRTTTVLEYRVPPGVLAQHWGALYMLSGIAAAELYVKDRLDVPDRLVREVINDCDRAGAYTILTEKLHRGDLDRYLNHEFQEALFNRPLISTDDGRKHMLTVAALSATSQWRPSRIMKNLLMGIDIQRTQDVSGVLQSAEVVSYGMVHARNQKDEPICGDVRNF